MKVWNPSSAAAFCGGDYSSAVLSKTTTWTIDGRGTRGQVVICVRGMGLLGLLENHT